MDPSLKTALWNLQGVSETNTAKFINYINEKHGLSLQTYHELYQWSIGSKTLACFWTDAYNWLELELGGDGSEGNLVQKSFTAKNIPPKLMFPPPKFFPTATLNIAEIIFRGRKDKDVAIFFAREDANNVEKVTWSALKERVREIRSALISSGVGSGHVVAAVISNSAYANGYLFGDSLYRCRLVVNIMRYGQQGYIYAELQSRGQGLTQVVLIPNSKLEISASHEVSSRSIGKFLKGDREDRLVFESVPFSHPAFILFSSGTTGAPKCIVHSMGGVALKTKVDTVIQHDVRTSDVVFQYTTTSWVMWVLNLMNLSCAASMLLYDGSPFHPRPTILLELSQAFGVSVFGTSPRYLSTLKSFGIVPRQEFDLSRLRIMLSRGSVLSTELYEWFYSTAFPPSAQLISMSGGTDIAGFFVCGTPLLPIYAGEIQCKALGMAVDIYDPGTDESVSVEDLGAPGELVCKRPFPSQPLAFLGEKRAQQYNVSYFERYGPNVWCQGDFVQRSTDTGGILMLGRSDGVLNPSGVRFGSAEIYAVTETIPEILDSIYVGQKRKIDANERVLLFIKMKPGSHLTSDLMSRINAAIRDRYSPRHVPAHIFEVEQIPYTANGKKCEINVKHAINGNGFAVAGTVANPLALKAYEKYRDLPTEESKVPSVASKL